MVWNIRRYFSPSLLVPLRVGVTVVRPLAAVLPVVVVPLVLELHLGLGDGAAEAGADGAHGAAIAAAAVAAVALVHQLGDAGRRGK